jgi:putative ABC transport system permease protein
VGARETAAYALGSLNMQTESRWTRVLLRLLPRGFRDRFGGELAESVSSLAADARERGGRVRQGLYVITELLALIRLAIALRARSPGAEPGRHHEVRSMGEQLLQDVRWALRHARRRPLPTLAIVLTIGLSVGITTTTVGLAGAVLWQPMPFDDAGQLVFLWEETAGPGQTNSARVTGGTYAAWQQAAGPAATLSLFGAAGFTLDTPSGPTTTRGVRVSANYFDTLGIRPLLGRTFSSDDETPGNERVIVLSSSMWRERFGGRTDVVNTQVMLSGQRYTVIGVMPPATYPAWPVNPADVSLDPDAREFWVPIPRTPELRQATRAHVFGVLARVHGAGDPARIVERLRASTPTNGPDPHDVRAAPFRRQFVADAQTPLLTLAVAALALLLIACANLAALQASAFESRRAELATRVTIGAGAWQLVRQIVIELLVVVGLGTLLGVVLARAAVVRVPALLPPSVPLMSVPAVDLQAVLFAAALGLLAAALISAWPLVRLLGSLPSPRGIAPRHRHGVYRVLVVSQLAIAVAMTSAAGLLGRSLQRIEHQAPGFDPARLLVADLALRSRPPADVSRSIEDEARVLDALANRPGVAAVALAYDHPLEANWSENPTITGESASDSQRLQVDLRIVSPGYFEALGVDVLEGRTLTDRDAMGSPGAVLVNEALARTLGGGVLGRRLRTSTPSNMFPGAPSDFEIVGIVVNERFRGLERPPQPAYYISTRQFPQTGLTLMVRTTGDPLAQAAEVRATVRRTDPAITVDRFTTIDQIMAEQLVSRRVTSEVINGFATTALGLAALGMYGLLMIAVASRRREIGIRLAVGASPASIALRTLRDGLASASLGVLLGLGLALISGRYLHGLLVDVSASDPVLLGLTAAVLLGTATVAAAIPAWRAARVDPLSALRQE